MCRGQCFESKMKLKKTDLRLGNLIQYPGWNKDGSMAIFHIRDLYLDDAKIALTNGTIHLPSSDIDYLKPISLNDEWLVKFGFKKSPSNNSFYLSIPELKAEVHFENFRGGLVCVLYCSTGSFIPSHIEFVHQLQNLYHALTGKDL